MKQSMIIPKLKSYCKTLLDRTALWLQLTIFIVLITTLVAGYLIYKDYTSTRNLTITNQINTTEKFSIWNWRIWSIICKILPISVSSLIMIPVLPEL